MLKRASSRSSRMQSGSALLDALLATLVLTIVGMGPLLVTAKALVAQRQSTVQQLTAVELRELMQMRGVRSCDELGTHEVRVGDNVVQVAIDCPERGPVAINGVPLTLSGAAERNVRLSVTAPDWFGGSGKLLLEEVGAPEGDDGEDGGEDGA
ncbi:hypothetical protein [Pseudazoarcus pumilus]|nr:hypothetical protein [Pseudazoarcus pumilus]